ncbi:MAG: STAS domain-containing protein [Candidatus Latescibacterota bacterium]|jgi:anti-sigma B factor antagonist
MAVDGIVVSVISSNTQGVSILKVSGYLDTTTAGELENALYGLLKKKKYQIVVDLSGVNYISSAGWGIFIGEIKTIRDHGGDLKLAGMNGDVREVYELLEFHSILSSYEDADEAASSFGSRVSDRS